MKILKLLIILCGTFLTTAGFGQVTYTWTGAGDGTNIDSAANYGGTLPNASAADIVQFDGTVPGNLSLNYSSPGNWQSGPGQSGISILFGSAQGHVSLDNRTANANPPNIAIYDILIQAGAGGFSWGTNGNRVNYAARPGGAVHAWVNNSSNPARIGNQIHYVAGGGAAYTWAFGGTGDWVVNSWLTTDNGAGVTFTKNGSGTATWNPTGYSGGSGGIVAINVNEGTLSLTAPISKINNTPIANLGTFIFNLPSQAQTLAGVISGTGEFRVNSGTVTLQGASTYSGNTVLNGGVAVVNGAENVGVSGPLGLGNTISFAGGTLQFSVNNTFDYSPRFSTDPGQAIRIDTGGQNVTFASALTSSGGTLTKLAPGTLTLSGANTYNGLTAVGAGKLVIQGSAGTGNITVSNSAALGATGGSQIQPATLTVGTSGSATLEFNNVTSTATPLIAAGTVSAGGAITININSGTFVAGQDYPLLSWTSGSAPAVNLGTVIGAAGTLNTNGNTIRLNVSALAYTWSGVTDGNWDATTAGNWLLGGSPVLYSDPNPVLFDDTATGTTNVTVNAVAQPGGVTVNNSTKTYSIASSGANRISGSGSLTKAGSGSLTLSGGVNDYTGATTISGGTVSIGSLANGGGASDIGASGSSAANLVLNGGTLQYTGTGATSDHLFTVGTAGARLDATGAGTLNLNNAGALGLSGSGARTLTLNNTNASGDTLAAIIGDSGGPTAVTKTGPGKWILSGNNTFSGLTTIANGVLQIGAGGASGTLGTGNVVDNGTLNVNVSSTLTLSGNISGTGRLTNDGPGTVILTGNNTYSGGTYINAGTLQFGNGGAGGTVIGNAPLLNNGTVIFNTTTPINISAFGNDISGTGNLIVRAGASVTGGDGNAVSYTGWTLIDAGGTFQPCTGQTTGFQSSSVTNNGRLVLISQSVPPTFGISNNIVGVGSVWMDTRNQNAGQAQFSGTNTYTGGTFIGGGGIVLGDGVTPGAGSIVGSVVFTNTTGSTVATFNTSKRLLFNRPDTFTFANDIISAVSDGSTAANSGSVEQQLGTVTLTGNNSYPGDTTVAVGATLQSGNGGTSGSIGSGAKVINGTLIYNRSANDTVNGVVSAAGSLVKDGTGTLTLTNANTFTGTTTVSNGTLVINGSDAATSTTVYGGTFGGAGTLAGAVTTASGTTLAPGASVGTLTINNNLDIGGNIAIEVNKSLAQSNDLVVVSGTLIKTGAGNLTVANLGPALQVGDKFTLFSQPLTGGAVTVTGAGATWQNDLATDGSITVLTVSAAQPTLNFTPAGGSLQFSWTGSGYKLQAQTNSLSVGLANNWGDYPGGGTSPVSVPVNVANGAVFFRLISTP